MDVCVSICRRRREPQMVESTHELLPWQLSNGDKVHDGQAWTIRIFDEHLAQSVEIKGCDLGRCCRDGTIDA